jgi:hypothetical protein
MPSKKEKIIKKSIDILEERRNGMRYAELVNELKKEMPEENPLTIVSNISALKKRIREGKEKNISNPDHGFYILKKYLHNLAENNERALINNIPEENFYLPFAEYLMNELDECTSAIPLGGSIFQDRWGTPDVIGTYKIIGMGQIQPPIEVVSAEIKIDTNQLITSFGQACSYKLFSHKVYLLIPKESRTFDIKRINSLCLKFGIGLILFNKNNEENPEFEILTRAIKNDPDYFYLNKYMRLLPDDVASKLF